MSLFVSNLHQEWDSGDDTNLLLQLHLNAIQRGFTLIHPLFMFFGSDEFLCENSCATYILWSLLGHLLQHFATLIFLFFQRQDLAVQQPFLATDSSFPFL